MKKLFRGYIVVVWEETEISSDNYNVLNTIVVRKYIKFYMKCQKNRNEAYHNAERYK